jgi:hypothetical protein
MKKTKKNPKVRDMKPTKDAKGGGGLHHYPPGPTTNPNPPRHANPPRSYHN